MDTARPRTRDYLPSICIGWRIFCTSVRQWCSARMTHRPFSGSRFPLFGRCSQHVGTKFPSSSPNFAHRNRAISRSDVRNSDGRFLDAKPRGIVLKLLSVLHWIACDPSGCRAIRTSVNQVSSDRSIGFAWFCPTRSLRGPEQVATVWNK